MMETASMQVYVGDFVNFSHSSLGIICAKVQRLYMKVIIFCYAICVQDYLVVKMYYKQENHHRGADATEH